ncbi:MAG: chemotaxis protein CheA [Candidimonas sp.]|nr:MAG: chemotaxis protein CheA [Candidimonas sp.]
MSQSVDLSEFYDTFFDEAEELLAQMERDLLQLDCEQPDGDTLNSVFRAAHSIKGGAATFGCFPILVDTTHHMENVLDRIRHGELALGKSTIDVFLGCRDVLVEQVSAYRDGNTPDEAAARAALARLGSLADGRSAVPAAAPETLSLPPRADGHGCAASPPPSSPSAGSGHATRVMKVTITGISAKDSQALLDEMAIIGTVLRHAQSDGGPLVVELDTGESNSTISSVCCFVVNADQVNIEPASVIEPASIELPPAVERVPIGSQPATISPPAAHDQSGNTPDSAPKGKLAGVSVGTPGSASGGQPGVATHAKSTAHRESSTIRVDIHKVDQIINLVGELVITQAMLRQATEVLGASEHPEHTRLVASVEQLERNARDLQEAVMSMRMMPMEYVFSRFPRVVREGAETLGKEIELVTRGQATELDKGLIEHIIDPLTHLVRNSLDHGIEAPGVREAAGKPRAGRITLSAEHSGGQIIIEVADDGAGLNRERILAKARSQGLDISGSASDEEVWQLIFAPGFSTAEKVTDISGRGVGMDVVRRNIQDLGGHIYLSSREGMGTTTRIVLPLTLAILDGMSVGVGKETFILPLNHVMESLQPQPGQIRVVSDGESVLHMRGEYLPLIALKDVFGIEEAVEEPTRAIAVLLAAGKSRFALLVDRLVGQHQVVVKSLEANYRKVPGVSAATILGDGSVAFIIDVFALASLRHGAARVDEGELSC